MGLNLGEGNPSRSDAVNGFVGVVKVHKVRQTSSKSQATRAFSMEEFIKLLQVSEAVLHNNTKCACFRALVTLQWQMIGRVDNMQKTKVIMGVGCVVSRCVVAGAVHSHCLLFVLLFYR